MLRHRLVRQSAMNISSGSDSSSTMPSPQPVRRRRNSQDSKMYRQLSSESMDNLLGSPISNNIDRKASGRRHSVACGVLYVDVGKPSLKSAFNSAFKKVSSACSVLSSAPSSTFNLSPPKRKDEDEVILPHVLGTFQKSHMPIPPNCSFQQTRSTFQVNRRFSTDCPPPSYLEVASAWKQPVTRQRLTRQQEVFASKGSLGAVEDDDGANLEDRLVN